MALINPAIPNFAFIYIIQLKDNAPIIFIDDDRDDLQILSEAMKATGAKNEVLYFDDSTMAVAYLSGSTERPLFIMCDINMPKLDGFALRRKLMDNGPLQLSVTPFIYLSTASHGETVNKGYSLCVQGYFQKPSDFAGVVELLKNIITYWTVAKLPVINLLEE